MDEEQQAACAARLRQIRAELQLDQKTNAEVAATVELDQSRMGRLSRMDALQNQALSKDIAQRREVEFRRIDSALVRLERGNYGLCVRCEEEIAPARLEFDPATPLCVDCASG